MSEYIQNQYKKGTQAYWAIADFTQEQIDGMLEKMALRTYEHAEELGTMVAEETQMGDAATNIGSMQRFPLFIWHYLKGKNSFGLLEDNQDIKIQTYGKAMGVVACLTPSTTHISNGFEMCMKAVKSGNAIVLGPHPRAWKSAKRLVEVLSAAVKEAGGPDNLIQSVEDPTIELTAELMAVCDVVVGTGGADMVHAAYSSGTPAFGVGQGNVPVILSESYPKDEMAKAVATVAMDRWLAGGVACTSPQFIFCPRSRKDEVLELYQKNGACYIEDKETIDRIRSVCFPDGDGRINRKVVGINAMKLAKAYGVDAPEGTRLFLLKVEDGTIAEDDLLYHEIMNPTSRIQFYDDYKTAVELARRNLFYEGAGHSAQIWSFDQDEIDYAAKRLPVVRVLVRQGANGVSNLTLQNGLAPSTSVGCGTWGGNGFSDNTNYTTLQNHTMVIYPVRDPKIPSFEEVFGKQEA